MKVAKLTIKNFRGIKSAELYLPDHVVLIGDNNTGKSTIFEALDLVLGPDRLNRRPVVDEHDFYNGEYILFEEGASPPTIEIEVTIVNLSEEQKRHFHETLEWWNNDNHSLHTSQLIEDVDTSNVQEALRVCFIGKYDVDEDDFVGATFFSRSIVENENPLPFKKKDKQHCGFLYLRTIRTGSRALSLEKGSLLDIILRIKEIRPQMWEKTIDELKGFDVASDPDLGISGVLSSIGDAIKKYVTCQGFSGHII